MQTTTHNPAQFVNTYSPQNVNAILTQCPDATAIASYRQWLELGRQVRKGERGIRILAPVLTSDTTSDNGAVKPRRYREVSVFDISQTDPVATEQLPTDMPQVQVPSGPLCPACTTPSHPDDTFCGECGTRLAAPAIESGYHPTAPTILHPEPITGKMLGAALKPAYLAITRNTKLAPAKLRKYRWSEFLGTRYYVNDEGKDVFVQDYVRVRTVNGVLVAEPYSPRPETCTDERWTAHTIGTHPAELDVVLSTDDCKAICDVIEKGKPITIAADNNMVSISQPSACPGKTDTMRIQMPAWFRDMHGPREEARAA